jgi:hypothetical protein
MNDETNHNHLQKKQQQRRAFFHDDVIVRENKINPIIDDTIEENLSTIPNHNEENPTNKSFKRKVVSFSAMPCEKKVADGKIYRENFEVLICFSSFQFVIAFVICKKEVIFLKFVPMLDNFDDYIN